MASLGATLKLLIEQRGLNISALARETGLLQPVLHRIVNSDTDNPRIGTILPVADYFGITVEQLIGREPLPDSLSQLPKTHALPVIDWSLAAHWPEVSEEQKAELIVTDAPVGEQSYALRVHDSAMAPRFNEGTLLIIDAALTPSNGDFAIVELAPHTTPTFKQVLFDGKDTYLKPMNPDFKTICLEADSPHRFLGVAVEAKTRLKKLAV